MAERKKYGCIIFEDVFERLDATFTDEQLGRIFRASFNYGFNGVIPESITDPVEKYACSELTSIFDRNRESYDGQSLEGKINAAKKYAKTKKELATRLEEIGLEQIEIGRISREWQEKRKV